MLYDISKCTATVCDIKQTCLRFRGIPERRQSYTDFSQLDGKCNFFIPITSKELIEIEKGDKNV